jgi:hypothetical protein
VHSAEVSDAQSTMAARYTGTIQYDWDSTVAHTAKAPSPMCRWVGGGWAYVCERAGFQHSVDLGKGTGGIVVKVANRAVLLRDEATLCTWWGRYHVRAKDFPRRVKTSLDTLWSIGAIDTNSIMRKLW